MKSRGLQIKVGLLVLVALGVLTGLIFTLGAFSTSSGMTFYVDFKFIGNLTEGAPVKVSGIKVGKVEEIQFLAGKYDKDVKRRVFVRLKVWVEKRALPTLRTDSNFYINTQGVLGEQYLEITPGNQDDKGHRALRADEIRVGEDPPRADLIVARLYAFLESITDLLQKERKTIVAALKNGARALDTLDGILRENRPRVGKLLDGADKLVADANQLTNQIRGAIGEGKLVRGALWNVFKVTSTLDRELGPILAKAKTALDGAAELGKLLTPEQRAKITKLLDRILSIAGKVDVATGDAARIVSDIRHGRGSVGAFIMDREIYEDVKEMVRDLKRNPWKFFWKE